MVKTAKKEKIGMIGVSTQRSWEHKHTEEVCMKRLFPMALCVLILIICLCAPGCGQVDKAVSSYADNFYDNLNKEIETCTKFVSAYEDADFDTEYGITLFRNSLPGYLQLLNSLSNSYQSACPTSAPQELKDAVSFARDGTAKVITGIETIDSGLVNSSYSQLSSGENTFNEGVDLINQSATKYNSFAQAGESGPDIGLGILIGTGVLWGLGLLVVHPLAQFLTRRRLARLAFDGYLPQDESELSEKASSVYNRTYILVDLFVLSIAGFLMGLLVGWFFIGISWRARDWPGLIAFIGLSYLGSVLHG